MSLGTGSSIQVTNYAPDPGPTGPTTSDLTYYSAPTAITTSTLFSSETGGLTVDNNFASGVTATDALAGGTVTSLLVGAAVGESTDAFKVTELVLNNGSGGTGSGGSTPEPGTFGLIGLALTGLGIAGRKLKLGKS